MSNPSDMPRADSRAQDVLEADEAQLRQLFADYSERFEPNPARISSQLQKRFQSAEAPRTTFTPRPLGLAVAAVSIAMVVSVFALVDGPWADQRVKTVDGAGIAEPATGEGIDGEGFSPAGHLDSPQDVAGNEQGSISSIEGMSSTSSSTRVLVEEGGTPPSTASGPSAGVGSSVGTEVVQPTVKDGSPSPSRTDPTAGPGSSPSSAVISSTTPPTTGLTSTSPSQTRPAVTRPSTTVASTTSTTRATTKLTTAPTTATTASSTTTTTRLTTTSTTVPTVPTVPTMPTVPTVPTVPPVADLEISSAPLPSRVRFSANGYIDWAVTGSRNDGKIITLDDRVPSISIQTTGPGPDRTAAPIEILWTDGQSEEDRDINDTWWSAPADPFVFTITNDGQESPQSVQLYVGGSAQVSVRVAVANGATRTLTVPSPGRVVTIELGPGSQNKPFVITLGAQWGSGTVALGAVALR